MASSEPKNLSGMATRLTGRPPSWNSHQPIVAHKKYTKRMAHSIKSTVPLLASGCLLTAAGFFLFFHPSDEAAGQSAAPTDLSANPDSAPSRSLPISQRSIVSREVMAAKGHLWEPSAASPADARRVSMAVRQDSFDEIRQSRTGDRVLLNLSPNIPVIDSRVTHRSIHDDGTRVTHLQIPGHPEGQLIVQENEEADFFLAQLYYEEDPVAYEFRKTDEGLIAKRHPLSDLVCAIVGKDGELITMGLPKLQTAEARGTGKGKPDSGGGGGGGGGGGRTISISDASVTEGTGGSNSLTFTLNLSSADKRNDIMVNYATSDGTATAPSDYAATSGTAIFPRRSTRTTITIPVTPDSAVEGNETFFVNLFSPSGATIADDTATGTIFNDDLGASISTYDITTNEGDSGSTIVSFSVDLSAPAPGPVTVNYTTKNGSALAGSDYLSAAGTLTFLAGETTKQVSVEVLGDTDYENTEDFSLLLSNANGAPINIARATCLILNDDSNPSGVPVHNSLPGATAVAYLDMDGHTAIGTVWSGGATIVARGIVGTLSQNAMTNIWERVAEDFAPFEINVTTDEAIYLAAPSSMRIRCVITPDNEWYGAAGGVAYINSFNWTGDTPCWVFSDMLGNSAKNIAEASSHEVGHTLALRHDGRTSPEESYYYGHGSGETSWAPIMGVGYGRSLVQWSKGEYLAANNTENDLAIITGQNGFGYRQDDHPNSPGSASILDQEGFNVSGAGLIERQGDIDVFSFTVTTPGVVELLVEGSDASSNLDILAEIRDANGTLIASDNDPNLLSANPVVDLDPGTYYLSVSGTGKGDPLGIGYTDYGSLGVYTITGQTP